MNAIETIVKGWRRVWDERRQEESVKLPLAILFSMAASGVLIGAATGTLGLVAAGVLSAGIGTLGLWLIGRAP